MYGFIGKGVLCFVRDVHGQGVFDQVVAGVGVDLTSPDLYLSNDRTLPHRIMAGLCDTLGRPLDDLLEDFGTYLVCHPSTGALRRLMRFSGQDFHDFVAALPDLAPRVDMAVPGLVLPPLDVEETDFGAILTIHGGIDGYAHVVAGVIRAMADDYGALIQVDLDPGQNGAWTATMVVLDVGFDTGRAFTLLEVGQ